MQRIDLWLSDSRPWPADAGLETWMTYGEGFDLPHFAAFMLLERDDYRAALDRYFGRFIDLARRAGTGFVLEAPTWRSNMGWAAALGLDAEGLRQANLRAVAYVRRLRARHETADLPMPINGAIGPSADGYRVDAQLTAEAAEALHAVQVAALAEGGVDHRRRGQHRRAPALPRRGLPPRRPRGGAVGRRLAVAAPPLAAARARAGRRTGRLTAPNTASKSVRHRRPLPSARRCSRGARTSQVGAGPRGRHPRGSTGCPGAAARG